MKTSQLAPLFVICSLSLVGCSGETRTTEKKRDNNAPATTADKNNGTTSHVPGQAANGPGFATPNDLFHGYRRVTEAPTAAGAVALFAPKKVLEAAIDCADGIDWWLTEIEDKATALATAAPSFHLAKLGSRDVTAFFTRQRSAAKGDKLKILSLTKCAAKAEIEVLDLLGDPPMPKLRMWRSADTGWFLDSYEPNPAE